MYSKTSATKMTRKTSVIGALGVLQDDPENDVADIPAAIGDFLQKIVQILPKNDHARVLVRAVEPAQVVEQLLVSIAFDALQLLVRFADVFQSRSAPQPADQVHHHGA